MRKPVERNAFGLAASSRLPGKPSDLLAIDRLAQRKMLPNMAVRGLPFIPSGVFFCLRYPRESSSIIRRPQPKTIASGKARPSSLRVVSRPFLRGVPGADVG